MNILTAGNPARKKLDALQSAIAELLKERAAVEGAIYPPDVARERIAKAVNGAKGGKYHLTTGAFIGRPTKFSSAPSLPEIDWRLLIALLGEEVVVDRLAALLPEDGKRLSLTDEQRTRRLADVKRKLRDAEEKEEREVLRLVQDEQWTVFRRADADPAVLLDVWLHAGPPENVASGPAEPVRLPRESHVNDGAAHMSPETDAARLRRAVEH